MPLHLDAIAAETDDSLVSYLLSEALDHAEDVITRRDNRILHVANRLKDSATGERIGKIVFTLSNDPEARSAGIIDIDITIDSAEKTSLRFLKKLPGSSDANEYYDVEAVAGGQHLQIETVNRNAVDDEDIVDSVLEVRACAFPFRLGVFEDIEELNRSFARGGDSGDDRISFSETFAAPGSLVSGPDAEQAFSVMIGTVRSLKDISLRFGIHELGFTVARVDSALGLLPVAMSREVFDLRELAVGSVLYIYADVKADFAPDQ